MLATPADVAARLGRELSGDELRLVSGWLSRADRLVRAWLRCDPPDPTPDALRDAVVDIVERAVSAAAGESTPPLGVTETSDRYGPFDHTRKYSQDTLSGMVFLTRQDKVLLSPFRCRATARAIRTW